MPALSIILDGEGAWPDLPPPGDKLIHLTDEAKASITALRGGMESGSASVALRLELPDGRTLLWETSLRLFLSAADAFRIRYGDPRESGP